MAPPSNRTLVIVRHAHRDKTEGREKDNGLSPKGRKQAKRLDAYYKENFGKTKALLLSSRKLRCVETLEPIGERIDVSVDESPLLMEEESGFQDLQKRVKKFCDDWTNSEVKLTLACSHGDWIPLAIRYLVGANVDLKKGGWAQIEMVDGAPKLHSLIQELPD